MKRSKYEYWWNDYWPIVAVLGIIATLLLICAYIISAENAKEQEHKSAFMGQCLEDHKQYECDALWGQAKGSSSSTVIIPIVTR